MRQKHTKILMALITVSLLIMPVKAHALITTTGNSLPGSITALGSILIPFPIINLSITETGPPTDFFGIAQLTISEHDNTNKYNNLKITMGSDAPLEIPVPYGSFGLSYLMAPGWPSIGVDQSDLYAYLSVAYGSVIADVSSNADITLRFEKEGLLELLEIFVPGTDLSALIGEGPFDIGISLTGGIEGTATEINPAISGAFDFSLTLPENLIGIEFPVEIPIPNEFGGTLSIEASFDWVPFALFSSVNLSLSLTLDGEEPSPLDPITFDLLPSGTLIFYLDKQE